jgi:hypothetical protein
MQNSLPSQMFMLTTRIGENSKMIITGDLLQSDLKVKNGLLDFIEKYNHYSSIKSVNNIDIIQFDKSDVERSQIVKTIIEMYSHECNTNHTEFYEKIKTMHIYNIPIAIDTISQLMGSLMPLSVRQKIVKYDKVSSEKPLQTIDEILNTMSSSSFQNTIVFQSS